VKFTSQVLNNNITIYYFIETPLKLPTVMVLEALDTAFFAVVLNVPQTVLSEFIVIVKLSD
jgi:hypothetical protein